MGCEQEERIVADTWVLSAGHKVDTVVPTPEYRFQDKEEKDEEAEK